MPDVGKIVLIKFDGYILEIISIDNYDEEKFHDVVCRAKMSWDGDDDMDDYLKHMLSALRDAGFIFTSVDYDYTNYD